MHLDRKQIGDGLGLWTFLLLVMIVVFITILSIEPDHHDPPCGGGNIVVALGGPQGASAHAPGTSGCRPLAIADVSGATLLLVPFAYSASSQSKNGCVGVERATMQNRLDPPVAFQ